MNPESSDEQPDPQNAEEFVAELVDESTGADESPSPDENPAPAATDAHVAPTVAYDPTILVPPKPFVEKLPPSPMSNLAAKGGAIGAIVLGVLAFIGSFITSYAILNSFMGLALGLWGLKSNHRRIAMIGMGLCLISAFFCVVEISSWLQTIWPSEESF